MNSMQSVLDYFDQICAIPRCSGNEKRISEWIQEWAKAHSFDYKIDSIGNLVIYIPASTEYLKAPTIILQGHLDMVCEKTPDSQHNFLTDPIYPIVDNDWIKTKDTTLGADNGIAIALAMAIATDDSFLHPPLELLFTVNEETGLNGAIELDTNLISGRLLINMDSEEEGIIIIGCAGGHETNFKIPLKYKPITEQNALFRIQVSGLIGGHSGVDIHRGRANAIQVLARVLQVLEQQLHYELIHIQGGTAHNAIPRNAEAIIAFPFVNHYDFQKCISDCEILMQQTYAIEDSQISITLSEVDSSRFKYQAIDYDITDKMIPFLVAFPHGVDGLQTYDQQLFIETSSNLAILGIHDDTVHITTTQRSSNLFKLTELHAKIQNLSFLSGYTPINRNKYPPWKPASKSPLLDRCQSIYSTLFHKQPNIQIMHAGLECAIIGNNLIDMDMISIGPTIKNAHSPFETMHIPSVEKVYNLLKALLSSY